MSPPDPRALAARLWARWRAVPVAFALDLWGMDLSPGQISVMRSVARSRRVAVRSGHKNGKSTVSAVLALWRAICFPGSQIILTAPTERTVEHALWKEVKSLLSRAKLPLGGKIYKSAKGGVTWDNGTLIQGRVASKPEAFQGISGDVFYILDEASGIDSSIIEIADTSPMGKVLLISNPTKLIGKFFDIFDQNLPGWEKVHLSSLELAAQNTLKNGRFRWPGLANSSWLSGLKEQYGENSAYWRVRVLGEFDYLSGEKALFSAEKVKTMSEGWRQPLPSDGKLEIGIDPGGLKDCTSIVWRRGLFASESWEHNDPSGNSSAVIEHLKNLIRYEGVGPGEIVIRVDNSNMAGNAIIQSIIDWKDKRITIERISYSQSPASESHGMIRDSLWLSFSEWVGKGGKVPYDRDLIQLCNAVTYETNAKEKLVVMSKKDMKKVLRRSPDHADAMCLACYDPSLFRGPQKPRPDLAQIQAFYGRR